MPGIFYLFDITSDGNGTVNPGGVGYEVLRGSDFTVEMAPSPGFVFGTLTVDGVRVPVSRSYTFFNVQAVHSLVATFDMDFINPICDALVTKLQTLNGTANFTAAGALVERNPGPIDWQNAPRPYIAVAYVGTTDNSMVNAGPFYRAQGDFSVRFLLVPTGAGTIDRSLGERYAATVMQEIIGWIVADVTLGGVLASGIIWAKDSRAGVDPEIGNLLCGGEITFGATWEWTP